MLRVNARNRPGTPGISIGLITDLHYADADPQMNRFYRDSATKLRQAVETFEREGVAFAACLGDLIDAGETAEQEIGFLQDIDAVFAEYRGDRHYVLGNHDVWTLTKKQFLDNCGARSNAYAFKRDGFRFIVLDACFRADDSDAEAKNADWTETHIPAHEREWLRGVLESESAPTIVLAHQRLDDETDVHGVKNAPLVRELLENAGALAVLNGHDHRGGFRRIHGIPYITLKGAVDGPGLENNAFAVADIWADGRLELVGFGRQESVSVP